MPLASAPTPVQPVESSPADERRDELVLHEIELQAVVEDAPLRKRLARTGRSPCRRCRRGRTAARCCRSRGCCRRCRWRAPPGSSRNARSADDVGRRRRRVIGGRKRVELRGRRHAARRTPPCAPSAARRRCRTPARPACARGPARCLACRRPSPSPAPPIPAAGGSAPARDWRRRARSSRICVTSPACSRPSALCCGG